MFLYVIVLYYTFYIFVVIKIYFLQFVACVRQYYRELFQLCNCAGCVLCHCWSSESSTAHVPGLFTPIWCSSVLALPEHPLWFFQACVSSCDEREIMFAVCLPRAATSVCLGDPKLYNCCNMWTIGFLGLQSHFDGVFKAF